MIKPNNIPQSLRERRQWLVWKTEKRSGDKPTKVPYQVNGVHASSTDSATWNTFDVVLSRFTQGGYDGIGFVFSPDDPLCGIDLDGCRSSEGGQEWARKILKEFNSYAEISPSQSGVKIFIEGKLPFSGRKKDLNVTKVCDKQPGIEVYDQGRYFAVTGLRVAGPSEPQSRQEQLDSFCKAHWPDVSSETNLSKEFFTPAAAIERARKYLTKFPPAVSGASGHNTTYRAACILVNGFCLSRDEALTLLSEWNQCCQPPWSERELEHKVNDAAKAPGDRGYLRNAQPEQWQHTKIPHYDLPKQTKKVEFITLGDAARQYIGQVRAGNVSLIDTGIPDLDGGIGGGIERGEMIVLAARPSHGKSLVALQCTHNWTAMGMPVLFVTEEMSPMALGKRMLQYASALPVEHWPHDIRRLEGDLEIYEEKREAQCYIAANCGRVDVVAKQVTKAVKEHGIEAVVVDYAQLLSSPGRSRYEQITHTSVVLRQLANEHRITVLVLCQMSRAIEGRKTFEPFMSDIKETGQFEQDADVVLFIVWPHRINPKNEPKDFTFYVAKNRNRAINSPVIRCQIMPSRQMLVHGTYRDYHSREYVEPYKDVDALNY